MKNNQAKDRSLCQYPYETMMIYYDFHFSFLVFCYPNQSHYFSLLLMSDILSL